MDGFYPSCEDGTETSFQEKGGQQWFDRLQRGQGCKKTSGKSPSHPIPSPELRILSHQVIPPQ